MNPRAFLRVGTRASALARWQTGHVCSALRAAGLTTEIIEIHTTGDLTPDVPIASLGDPAAFTRQLDEALLHGRIDLAVHSLKDLPTELPVGIVLAAVSSREDPRDALVSRDGRGLAELPQQGRVATSSSRRRAQIQRARPDLQIVEARGNVDTRVARLDQSPELCGTILAVAGLTRLGLAGRINERLSLTLMLPAPGQAALALTTREDDPEARAATQAVHDEEIALCVGAERAVLRHCGGGCEAPLAAYAEVIAVGPPTARKTPRVIRLRARILSLDGRMMVEDHVIEPVDHPDQAERLGRTLAERLLSAGGAELLREAGPSTRGAG
jgi:hydroxymethylbilane synthase